MIEKDGSFHFIEEPVRVIVTVPSNLKDVRAEPRPMGLLTRDMLGRDNFTPRRLVVNFELVQNENPDDLTEFEYPIELKVYFTHKDYLSAHLEGKPLALAFWYGNKWVRFEEKYEVKEELIIDPIWAGYLEISIGKWIDPPVALGN